MTARGMTRDEGVWLRPLRRDDAGGVLAAFRSNPDMARQGDVTTPADAERYVENLVTSRCPCAGG